MYIHNIILCILWWHFQTGSHLEWEMAGKNMFVDWSRIHVPGADLGAVSVANCTRNGHAGSVKRLGHRDI